MNYCQRCHQLRAQDICTSCGGFVRAPLAEDYCFLIEKEALWAGMLEEVLKENEIPFAYETVLGPAVALEVGPASERYRFFVPYAALEKAQGCVAVLFLEADPL